ncbi:uncharacterized protein LOC118745785 [Rhagoletis pomonella]|uniref:uncharacterized protein LOC118745785 n=1 Tax=Rhagoletis pomonella TaxID=28610 RepID=UPI0017822494|nr:uncharacterized protein LOC118745785 [Rhagoletis pomonella]
MQRWDLTLNIFVKVPAKILSQRDIEHIMNELDDHDEIVSNIKNADAVQMILLPPDAVDAVSDTEDVDEDVQLLSDQAEETPGEVAGAVEILYLYNDDNNNINKSKISESISEQTVMPENANWSKSLGVKVLGAVITRDAVLWIRGCRWLKTDHTWRRVTPCERCPCFLLNMADLERTTR